MGPGHSKIFQLTFWVSKSRFRDLKMKIHHAKILDEKLEIQAYFKLRLLRRNDKLTQIDNFRALIHVVKGKSSVI